MSLDSLIAIAAFLLAAFAITARSRRLALFLRVSWIDWLILGIALVAIHYLQFYSFFTKIGWTPNVDICSWGITTDRLTYLVIVCAASLIGIHLALARLTPSRINRFVDHVQELLRSEHHYDLAKLIDSRLQRLINLTSSKSATVSRAATDILHQLITSRPFVRFLPKGYPTLAIRLARNDNKYRCEFLTILLEETFADDSSLLYAEIRNNQNLSSMGYHLSSENRLLCALFGDSQVAESCAVYRPIGDAVIAQLDARSHSTQEDSYLFPVDQEFRERRQWQAMVFVGIRFFDIMVWCALKQSVRWHMWLYYFPHFTERICQICDAHPEDHEHVAEWPNRYCYFLYTMFSAMRDWACAVTNEGFSVLGITLKSTSADHQNDNIPKSSIIALGRCLYLVLKTESIPRQFKNYLIDIVLNAYFDLRRSASGADYAKVLLNVITKEKASAYRTALAEGFDAYDKIPHLHDDVQVVEDAMRKMRQ